MKHEVQYLRCYMARYILSKEVANENIGLLLLTEFLSSQDQFDPAGMALLVSGGAFMMRRSLFLGR